MPFKEINVKEEIKRMGIEDSVSEFQKLLRELYTEKEIENIRRNSHKMLNRDRRRERKRNKKIREIHKKLHIA